MGRRLVNLLPLAQRTININETDHHTVLSTRRHPAQPVSVPIRQSYRDTSYLFMRSQDYTAEILCMYVVLRTRGSVCGKHSSRYNNWAACSYLWPAASVKSGGARVVRSSVVRRNIASAFFSDTVRPATYSTNCHYFGEPFSRLGDNSCVIGVQHIYGP